MVAIRQISTEGPDVSQLDQFLSTEPLPPSPNRRAPGRTVALIALLGMFVAILIAGSVVFVQGMQGETDYSGSGSGEVTVIVQRGDTLRQIGERLQAADVVMTVDAFVAAATQDAKASTIGPGRYTLRKQMRGSEAVALMLDPRSRAQSRLLLPEGLTMKETVAAAADATGIDRADFEAALAAPADLGLPGWAENRPEGFMFPATYDLAGDENATAVLRALVTRFDQAALDVDLVRRASAQGRTPYEILTVASLLEAEGRPADFSKVARVIYNRLDAAMPLQLDSTVAYATGANQLMLTNEQLQTDSPYNTYRAKGLPPTPINSPGEAAIEAALSPAEGPWLYFVTVNPKTGETKFAKGYQRFLKLKAELQANLAAGE